MEILKCEGVRKVYGAGDSRQTDFTCAYACSGFPVYAGVWTYRNTLTHSITKYLSTFFGRMQRMSG